MEKREHETTCHICEAVPSKYLCPRCGIPYCSTQCYRNESKHLKCSESFYRDCVMENVNSRAETNPEEVTKMKDILQRFNQEFTEQDDSDLNEIGSDLDSDDDEPLHKRMQGINLDDTEEVWKHLTSEERADFQKLISTTDACDIIPEWIPWWTLEPKSKLIQEVQDSSPTASSKIDVNLQIGQPEPISPIPTMSSLTKIVPNDHVKIGLSNVIAAYVWIARIYCGDTATCDRPDDVAGGVISLSAFLSTDTIFGAFEHAITNVPMKACQNPTLFDGGPKLHATLQQDVLQILSANNLKTPNSNKSYVISALSDCFRLFSAAMKERKKRRIPNAAIDQDVAVSANEFKSKAFAEVFPNPPPVFSLDDKLLSKAKRKVHYLLAFANEYDVL